MKSTFRIALLTAVAVCTLMAAETAARPACSAVTRGQFWPEAANNDGVAALRAAREGELAICTREGWRYRWSKVAVHWKSLLNTQPAVAARKTEKPVEAENHLSGLR